MTAFEIERAIDEMFPDAAEMTPKQASAVGNMRSVLWDKQKEELAAFSRSIRNDEAGKIKK